MEDKFNQIMIVFKYIEDKDVFQKFYTKMFANRLIKDTYASEEAEEMMITKLKGNFYWSKRIMYTIFQKYVDMNTLQNCTECLVIFNYLKQLMPNSKHGVRNREKITTVSPWVILQ